MSGPHVGQYLSGVPARVTREALEALVRGEAVDVHLMHRHQSGNYESSRLALVDGELVMLFADRSMSALSPTSPPSTPASSLPSPHGAAEAQEQSSERYVFLDTEFTSLQHPALLSVGMVDEQGTSFYGEINLSVAPAWLTERIGSFARTEVIPQFGRVPGSEAQPDVIARRAVDWLNGLSARIIFVAYDYSADYDLLEELLSLSTTSVTSTLKSTHVAYLLGDGDGAHAASCSYQESARLGLGRHHALADALALRARFNAVHG